VGLRPPLGAFLFVKANKKEAKNGFSISVAKLRLFFPTDPSSQAHKGEIVLAVAFIVSVNCKTTLFKSSFRPLEKCAFHYTPVALQRKKALPFPLAIRYSTATMQQKEFFAPFSLRFAKRRF